MPFCLSYSPPVHSHFKKTGISLPHLSSNSIIIRWKSHRTLAWLELSSNVVTIAFVSSEFLPDVIDNEWDKRGGDKLIYLMDVLSLLERLQSIFDIRNALTVVLVQDTLLQDGSSFRVSSKMPLLNSFLMGSFRCNIRSRKR
jgi:hypothetical protein